MAYSSRDMRNLMNLIESSNQVSTLLEYDRTKTATNYGAKVVLAIRKDSGFLPEAIAKLKAAAKSGEIDEAAFALKAPLAMLEAFERIDPTPHKQYTQWLCRMYANGDTKFEDIDSDAHFLTTYYEFARRKKLKPEHADINAFKTWAKFGEIVWFGYNTDDLKSAPTDKGQSTVMLDNDEVRIILLQDLAAAIYYGQGTRWCTAATKGTNYYERYASKGELYVLIPKKAEYKGERYQMHFETKQFMNELDNPVDFDSILGRFPTASEFFKQHRPDAYDNAFINVEDADSLINYGSEMVLAFVKAERAEGYYSEELCDQITADFIEFFTDEMIDTDSYEWDEDKFDSIAKIQAFTANKLDDFLESIDADYELADEFRDVALRYDPNRDTFVIGN